MTPSKSQAKNRQKIAIYTMLKNPGPLLGSFLKYHLSIGFDHIFLFFDDPHDESVPEAQSYPNITVIKNDESLRKKWEKTYHFINHVEIREYLDSLVLARQILTAGVAIEMALEGGIDWLLQVDIDELFYSPSQSVGDHFQSLTDRNISRVRYLNYEAVPESADVNDPFREVTLFKKNPATLDGGGITREQQQLIDSCPQLQSRFYFFYMNGKSAVRVREGVRTKDWHGVTLPEDSGLRARLHARIFKSKAVGLAERLTPRLVRLLERYIYPGREVCSTDPMILHYPCCGFENFLRKYANYGQFADTWFGLIDIGSRLGTFTIDSRDIVATGDYLLAREFYIRRVVMSNQEQKEGLVNAGLLCRIGGPATLLEELKGSEDGGRGFVQAGEQQRLL
jgi:glycosyl transferase family 2